MSTVFVTAATSQIGSLVVEDLLSDVKSGTIKLHISTRDAGKVPKAWTDAGVQVKTIDYTQDADAWANALHDAERILLISSNTGIGPGRERVQQHKNVIDGARKAGGVALLAYTSIINNDKQNLLLAQDHKDTEAYIKASGVPYVWLRNGWYVENFLRGKDAWKSIGVVSSSAPTAKISAAPRKDYAAAAAAILRPTFTATNAVYELGGPAFTLDELADAVSAILGKPVKHIPLSPDEYTKALVSKGIPEGFSAVVVDADVQADKHAALYTESQDLATLIGHPVGSYKDVLRQALTA